jgi:hypothetical protein
MEKKGKHSEEHLRKADKEYHEYCQKAEAARQEWESAVYKVSTGNYHKSTKRCAMQWLPFYTHWTRSAIL